MRVRPDHKCQRVARELLIWVDARLVSVGHDDAESLAGKLE